MQSVCFLCDGCEMRRWRDWRARSFVCALHDASRTDGDSRTQGSFVHTTSLPSFTPCPPPLGPACLPPTQLRNNASGGILIDTKEPGLDALRAELAFSTLSPEATRQVVVPTSADPLSPRARMQGTGIPPPPPTAVHPPRSVRFDPATVPQTTATHLWTVHPSKLPATVSSIYRPPHTTSSQDQFEYLKEELEPFDAKHFNKKNEMTEYLRSAIRTKVNLKATGH